MKYINKQYFKGQIVIIVAISLVVLIGIIGLAVDSGRGYAVKAKLNAAVDAASIAGARALSQGSTQDLQIVYATQAAIKFFHANYPNDYFGSTVSEPVVSVTFNPAPNCTPPYCGTVVTVSGTAQVPVTFMRVLNFNNLSVNAAGKAAMQTIDLAFVVDTTGSMSSVGATVKTRAQEFLNHLNETNDRVSLISYNFGAAVSDQIRTTTRGFSKSTLQSHINNFNFNGNTNFGEGFWQAQDQLNKVPSTPIGNRSNIRVILFFTDGSPNTFASTFSVGNLVTAADAVHCTANKDKTHICNCSVNNIGSSGSTGTCATGAAACACSASITQSRTCTGSLVTGDGSTGTASGLYQHETANQAQASSPCWMNGNVILSPTTSPAIYQIPAWYNAPHSGVVPSQTFQIAPAPTSPSGLRVVSATPSFTSINRGARNLAEEMAWNAREQGIYVFVLGLGDLLHGVAGPDNEYGERLLMCMANTDKDLGSAGGVPTDSPLSRCYAYNQLNRPNQPTGAYCWAKDDPKECYDKLASQILRLVP